VSQSLTAPSRWLLPGLAAAALFCACLGDDPASSTPSSDGGAAALDAPAGDTSTPPVGGDGGDAAVIRKCDPSRGFARPEPLATATTPVNTSEEEAWPRVSADGMTLYFVRGPSRDGGRILNGSVVRITRADPAEPFDNATSVAEPFDVTTNPEAPFLAPGSLALYFSNGSDRLYVSERGRIGDPFSLSTPINFGSGGVRDVHPYLVGGDVLYFGSTRASQDRLEIYQSTRTPTGTFGMPQPMGLQTASVGQQFAPVVSSDQRVVFFSADGTIVRAVAGADGRFGIATPVAELNDGQSFPGSLSADDCVFYFHSTRGGSPNFNLFIARAPPPP
jgi:hypothetical protein